MDKKVFLSCLLLLTVLTLFLNTPLLAAEKLKLGTAVKFFHPYYLPVMAAEQKGFWVRNGLEVEWTPFRRPATFEQALAAGSLNMGVGPATSMLLGAAKGSPVVMVAEVLPFMEFFIWVRTDSPIKKTKDLKGKKIGVSSMRSVGHAMAKLMVRRLGLEKDVKFIGTGGIVQVVAALRSGATDATVVGMFSIIAKLKLAGKVQALAGTRDYLPKEWVENVVEARKDFISNKPDTVRRAVKAFLQAIEFIKANPKWSVGKIKSFERLSDEQATYLYKFYDFTRDGKISRQAVKNVRDFLVQNKLISASAIPRVNDVYTSRFTD